MHVRRVGKSIGTESEHAESNDHDRRRVRESGKDGRPVVPE